MTPLRAKMYAWLFLLLGGAVGGNALLLQPRPSPASGSSAAIIETGFSRNPTRQSIQPRSPPTDPVPTKNELVTAVQRELSRLGYYPGPLDGTDGPVLRAAIWDFEETIGRRVTAQVSDDVLKLAIFESSRTAPRPGLPQVGGPGAEQLLRQVQQVIGTKIDGRFSEDTQRAIRDFETRRGLKASGRITADLMQRLLPPDRSASTRSAHR